MRLAPILLTAEKQNIVADINMDMFLPVFPLRYLEVQRLGESTPGNDIREIRRKEGMEVQADKEPDRNLFIRSDRYSFIKQGVPAPAFKFGYLSVSPEEANWLKEKYYAPSDDLHQPVDREAAQFDRILLDLGTRVASAKDRPKWSDNSLSGGSPTPETNEPKESQKLRYVMSTFLYTGGFKICRSQ